MKTTTPTLEEMEQGLCRFSEVKTNEEIYRNFLPSAVADAILPVIMPQKFYLLLGPKEVLGADPACGRSPDDFVAMMAECDPGVGPPLHAHQLTHEIFFVAKGRFRVEWGDDGENSMVLNEFDSLCIPPGCNRRFENISREKGFMFAIAYGHETVLRDTAGVPSTRARVLASAPPVIEGVQTTEWLDRMGLRYNSGVDDGAV